ncbi:MAG: hypothetical protein NXI22_22085, partial [bacterium]|nr:hypothetical protein [bacterium]
MRHQKAEMEFLADAIVRQVSNVVSGYYHMGQSDPPERFNGLPEVHAVFLLSRILEGLGYSVFFEQMVFGGSGKVDIWVGEPSGNATFFIEVKILYDVQDNLLNRQRFKKSVLGDIERLSRTVGPHQKVAVWFAFSPDAQLLYAGDDYESMRLGDAVAFVNRDAPDAVLTHRSEDLE